MTTATRIGYVTRRIATATSVIRTRNEDGTRTVVHGGMNGALEARAADVVKRLEAVAEKLEKAIP